MIRSIIGSTTTYPEFPNIPSYTLNYVYFPFFVIDTRSREDAAWRHLRTTTNFYQFILRVDKSSRCQPPIFVPKTNGPRFSVEAVNGSTHQKQFNELKGHENKGLDVLPLLISWMEYSHQSINLIQLVPLNVNLVKNGVCFVSHNYMLAWT